MRVLLFACLLLGCTETEDLVVKSGAPSPVVCLRHTIGGFFSCRDKKGDVWMCESSGANRRCVALWEVRSAWAEFSKNAQNWVMPVGPFPLESTPVELEKVP